MNRKNNTTYTPRSPWRFLLNLSMLAVSAALLLFSIHLVRTKLLQNAQDLGMALAESYAVEESMSLDKMEKSARMACAYVDEILASGGDSTQVQNWLQGYFSKMTNILGEGLADPYVVIDGKILGAVPWEGDAAYDFASTDWYRNALAADGALVCSDVYTDVITGQLVMTISCELSTPGDVLAMDVYIQNDALHQTAQTLPEGYSFYLCDQEGTLLYSINSWNRSTQDLQNFADRLMAGIRNGSLHAADSFFTDPSGVRRGAYFQQMDNGWTVIITIPAQSILMGDYNTALYVMAIVAVLLFALLTFMTIQDAVRSRKMKKADDTAHMLGDSFFTIYRVDFHRGSYEAIKLAPDVHDIAPKGEYAALLQNIGSRVEPATLDTFLQCFSLTSIQQRVLRGVRDYGGDYQRRFDDHYRWVNVRTLYDPKRTRNEVILCFRDVDVEKRQQMQHMQVLQEALDTARQSTRARSEFFSRMSHDMRTPLNAVIGFCKLALPANRAGQQEKVRDYLKKIDFAANQLLSLINDILELSRIEAGKRGIDQKEFDLHTAVDSMADLFRDLAQETHKQFNVRFRLRDTHVVGDAKMLGQILTNLLSNAFKYSNPGAQIDLEVCQVIQEDYSQYRFVVRDTGIGMTPEFLEHLFEPYARETSFSSHPTTGTGLGMPIVQNLVQQMSGTIQVESTLGKGSCFTVTLPLRPCTGAPKEEPAPTQEMDWTGLRVLVAEDNAMNREIVTELLTMSGASVIPAVNGEEAVAQFSASPTGTVDLILMDMQMPVMDGCAAASRIRALDRPDARTVPIVAVTANALEEDVDKTTRAGMNGHVSKPIDFRVLSEVVQKLLPAKRERPTQCPVKEDFQP